MRRLEIEHREAVEKVIDFLDLQQYRDSLIVNLPYGVRKVTELARALCTDPKLLLLDEPSSGLNVEETEDMAFWIQDIKNLLGITVLMVEHDMTLVSAVSDRVLALNYGRPIATGTPRRGAEPSRSHARVPGRLSEMAEPILRVTNIETYYGPIMAIRGVSFDVPKGDIVTILGSNGAGKTTVLKTICGVMDPQKGSVAFEGREIQRMDPDKVMRLGISHVPEGREVFPFLTVRENLRMGAYTRRDADEVAQDLEAVFGYFPVLQRARRPARGLAVGRRAADAGDQPRADGAAQGDAARRAVARPLAQAGEGHLRHHRAHQPRARRHHPAGRAERQHGAADRATTATCSRSAASSWPTPARA